jgi:small subunit ribosomal protein S17
MPKKQLKGIIISDKLQKTVVVQVERLKEHTKYKKRYKVHKKYKAHDEKNQYKTGDNVIIEECRPLSKDKKWKVISKATNKTTNKA